MTMDEERPLFELKEYRGSLVRQEQKPAYVFFHDSVLEEIARLQPRTIAQLQAIKGLGKKKFPPTEMRFCLLSSGTYR